MKAVISELPPPARSAAALGLLRGAASGRFMLQQCNECGKVQYPPRDACQRCLGSELPWHEVDNRGTLKAVTTVRLSNEPYFQDRLPWRVGIVSSDLGLSLIAHLLPSCRPEEPVTLSLRIDAAGRAVLVADSDREAMAGLRPLESDFLTDPAGMTILVRDGESELGREVAQSLLERGAQVVFADNGAAGDADAVVDISG
jgi:uncharacterized OB-fold protein